VISSLLSSLSAMIGTISSEYTLHAELVLKMLVAILAAHIPVIRTVSLNWSLDIEGALGVEV